MAKECLFKGCYRNVFGGKYCLYHQYLRKDKKKKPIAKVAKKRARINKYEYRPKADQYIKDHPYCEIRSPECTGYTQCVHHTKGKSSMELLCNMRFWKSSCFKCNTYIESHTAWAKENNHIVLRLTNTNHDN